MVEMIVPKAPVVKIEDHKYCNVCEKDLTEHWQENSFLENEKLIYLCNEHLKQKNL